VGGVVHADAQDHARLGDRRADPLTGDVNLWQCTFGGGTARFVEPRRQEGTVDVGGYPGEVEVLSGGIPQDGTLGAGRTH
jgi:hypothetical protein